MIADFINEFTFSFEVFPPKKDDEFEDAFRIMKELADLKPDFISVTYGAGGSRTRNTIEIASYIQNELKLPALAHLTCVGSKKQDILDNVQKMKDAGIVDIMALRGDRPAWMDDQQFNDRDFIYAQDLVRFLKKETPDLQLCGGCYPEKHFEAPNMEEDIAHLLEKQEAGCDYFISQLFFDNDLFYRFEDAAKMAGIHKPLIAGIMPITSAKQLGTTVSLSGSSVPKSLADLIATYGDTPEDMRKAGIEYAADQIRKLKEHGVDGIHIYSMNKPKVTREICEALK
ncbi:MAG: methylenetetrahydrofolate reductase [NAD(P)H] [Lachnospiraceae bacterium]|nr:methylenetetrahydrofolate reductase [NAD(P)H] [Lachnospiraceae bacterium]